MYWEVIPFHLGNNRQGEGTTAPEGSASFCFGPFPFKRFGPQCQGHFQGLERFWGGRHFRIKRVMKTGSEYCIFIF